MMWCVTLYAMLYVSAMPRACRVAVQGDLEPHLLLSNLRYRSSTALNHVLEVLTS